MLKYWKARARREADKRRNWFRLDWPVTPGTSFSDSDTSGHKEHGLQLSRAVN